jgi:hypothetical protein
MRTDFDLPPPTINRGEARKRLASLPVWHLRLIRDIRRALLHETPPCHMTGYLERQLVEYGELAYERSEAEQLRLDF